MAVDSFACCLLCPRSRGSQGWNWSPCGQHGTCYERPSAGRSLQQQGFLSSSEAKLSGKRHPPRLRGLSWRVTAGHAPADPQDQTHSSNNQNRKTQAPVPDSNRGERLRVQPSRWGSSRHNHINPPNQSAHPVAMADTPALPLVLAADPKNQKPEWHRNSVRGV